MASTQPTGLSVTLSGKQLRTLLQVAIVLLCVAAVWWTVRGMGVDRVFAVALEADPWWLAASLIPIALRFVIWSYKWRRMLLRATPIAHRPVMLAILSGAFINLVTPTAKLGGGIVRSLYIHRITGLRKSVAYGWSLADQLTNSLGNALLFAALALSAAFALRDPAIRFPLFAAGGLTVFLVYLYLRGRRRLWDLVQSPKWLRRVRKWTPEKLKRSNPESTAAGEDKGFAARVLEPLLGPDSSPAQAGSDLLLAACSFAALCIANAMVFKALGSDASILTIANAVILGYFAGTAVGTMGGIGATEFFLIQLYTYVGVDPALATAATLLHRTSYYGATLIFGGGAVLMQSHLKKFAQDTIS